MRVLIDEDLDTSLRHHFSEGIVAETVSYRGWKGLGNGDLLNAAEHDYDALVTMDGNIPDQQHLEQFGLAVLILKARSKKLPDLLELMPALKEALPEAEPGTYREIFPPEEGGRL